MRTYALMGSVRSVGDPHRAVNLHASMRIACGGSCAARALRNRGVGGPIPGGGADEAEHSLRILAPKETTPREEACR